jgi:hypothetical protein
MATESVAAPQAETVLTLASPEPDWIDEAWENSGLPTAIKNRLRYVDRKLCGLRGIAELLEVDRRNSMATLAFEGFIYDPLRPSMIENLFCAQAELLRDVTTDMEDLKDLVKKHGASVLR